MPSSPGCWLLRLPWPLNLPRLTIPTMRPRNQTCKRKTRDALLSRPTRESQSLSHVLQLTRGRYIYVPDKVVANPALVVVIHSCQSSAQAYFQNSLIPWHRGSDGKGYITVWPSSPHSGTCWDVSSRATLTHGGGGDTQAISNMIKYAISQYKVDANRVFVTGGSSGGRRQSRIWAAQEGTLG